MRQIVKSRSQPSLQRVEPTTLDSLPNFRVTGYIDPFQRKEVVKYVNSNFDLRKSSNRDAQTKFVIRYDSLDKNIPTNTKSFAIKFHDSAPRLKVRKCRP